MQKFTLLLWAVVMMCCMVASMGYEIIENPDEYEEEAWGEALAESTQMVLSSLDIIKIDSSSTPGSKYLKGSSINATRNRTSGGLESQWRGMQAQSEIVSKTLLALPHSML